MEVKQETINVGTKHKSQLNIIFQRKITAGPTLRKKILEVIDDTNEDKKSESVFSKMIKSLTRDTDEEENIQYAEMNSIDEVITFFSNTAKIAFGTGEYTSNEVADILLTKDDALSQYDTNDGGMFLFKYHPTSKNLKYYDALPLIINVGKTGDSLLGLNLHYLPDKLRIVFLKKLFGDIDLENITEDDVLYQLQTVDTYKYIKATYKQYKYTGITSRLVKIPIENWFLATLLPISKFQLKSRKEVWEISRKIIRDSERKL